MHVPMEMLKASAGFRMVHIPYTGVGPAVLALVGGQVDAVASGPATVVQQIKSGKLRALAHWGDKPLASMPEVPSLRQLGYPLQFAQWAALLAPAGTPETIIAKPPSPKHSATNAAPLVCPIRRASAIMPLAPPLRSGGAADISARKFGDWNSPKPMPQTAIRTAMSTTPGCAGSQARDAMPALNTAKSMPPSSPGGWRSDSLPASGAARATTIGHGVISRPVSTAS